MLIKSGPLQGHKYFVKSDAPILIGRNEEANIRIGYDQFCSRKHAIVSWEKDACYIQDLNSTNGTFVNKEKIEGKIKLGNQDIISLGATDIVVYIFDRTQNQKNGPDDEVKYDD